MPVTRKVTAEVGAIRGSVVSTVAVPSACAVPPVIQPIKKKASQQGQEEEHGKRKRNEEHVEKARGAWQLLKYENKPIATPLATLFLTPTKSKSPRPKDAPTMP